MNYRCFAVALMVLAASIPVVAQAPRAAAKSCGRSQWIMPRTPDGHPDLQGVWSYATLTPLERPAEFAGKEFLTEQEAAAYEKRRLQENNMDRRDGRAAADLSRAYNDFWWDRGTKVVVDATHVAGDRSAGREDSCSHSRGSKEERRARQPEGCAPQTAPKTVRSGIVASCSARAGRRCFPPRTTTTFRWFKPAITLSFSTR